ncbi:MAG: NADPH-dependent curcumin reductase [Verrucomicrobiota bacterium]
MSALSTKRIVLAARPVGKAKEDDFRLEQAPVPDPGSGQLLLRTRYLSLDPYMRGRMEEAVAIGDVMVGQSVVDVLVSNHPSYKAGDVVLAQTGWQTLSISNGERLRKLDAADFPITTGLGVLGMPGFTAYVGMRLIGQPKRGETVVVAAASGPVGSLVGQLARIAGARAVGIAGGPDKCAFVKNKLGFDVAIDHRTPDLAQKLAVACPNGIDVYFENVGGAVWAAAWPLLNRLARVPVCGLVSQFGQQTPPGPDRLPATMRQILVKGLTVRGFINSDFLDQFSDFQREVSAGVSSGQIKYREDVIDGLENAPKAFIGMLEGRNFGKVIIRVAD